MRALLLDIEGTTTPIDFVHKTLFPYARERVKSFVQTYFADLKPEIQQLIDERAEDKDYTGELDPTDPHTFSSYLEFLIDNDRKSTPLKSIQGKIWKQGYEAGEIRSIVFDDVPPAFRRWTEDGAVIAIYSSGSVLAQEMLFRYTDHGDLTPLIKSYFDTNVGGKKESESYVRIAEKLGVASDEIVFCSDVVAELDAARTAGLKTVLVIRDGNAPIEDDVTHGPVTTFADVE